MRRRWSEGERPRGTRSGLARAGHRAGKACPRSSIAYGEEQGKRRRAGSLHCCLGFERESDARRFQIELQERMRKFALSLHPDKTRLIEFGRFATERRFRRGLGRPETFTFLGFVHICGRSSKGGYQLRRKSRRDRMRLKLKEVRTTLMKHRHFPVVEQASWIGQVVRGYFAYHAVPTNLHSLHAFRHHVLDCWRRKLRRRSQRDRTNWSTVDRLAAERVPPARILHPWPSVRFAVKHPRWEPGA